MVRSGSADGHIHELTVVSTHLEGEARGGRKVTVEQNLGVELGRGRNPVDLRTELLEFGVDGLTVRTRQRVVGSLNREFAHPLKDGFRLDQGALGGLKQRDAVLSVARRLVKAPHLRVHLLGDGQTGRVVRRTVDPKTRREPLERLREGSVVHGELTVSVESTNVSVNPKSHGNSSLENKRKHPCFP
ncbi:hypothetical protein D3C86_1654460 [compost metagenome]